MNEFIHVKSVIAIILGLGLTHLIKGSVRFIQHPNRKKTYGAHLLWVFYIFLLMIHFWWWEFNLKTIEQWYFLNYLFIICYILMYFVLCAILYPEDLNDYKDYKDYFYSRKSWFFAILALTFGADFIDTYLKGDSYFLVTNTEYYIRNISHILLCLLAIKISNPLFHKILVLLFIAYEFSFILRLFNIET
ncbi:hypothetical protein [uncultured Marixanthomonas sp.]|uniref:hypothetical protein n=1 Tax=uncultured Marixanthomonas sp. TaxID=757245 RepID=UPI0030DCFBD8|tara:strand:+ start:1446 stop:2015 length:570 start_codon:yes stop_codon:yes gene_type:complete